MSLNHKRRIFRPDPWTLAWRDWALPPIGVLLAAAGAVAALVVAASLFLHSSEAPALAPSSSHLTADADGLAVLDGDTLRVGDQVVRLDGIAAPARGSLCPGDGQAAVDCGAAAANALASLVRGNAVDCTIRGQDGHGRPLAECLAAGRRLNRALVLDGWARAEAADLRQPEAAARAAGRGMWRTGS